MEKQILVFVFALIGGIATNAQTKNAREFEYTSGDTVYTMKQYVFCLYLSGENRSQSKEEAARLQAAHLAHLGELETKGLIVAGPFDGNSEKRGVLLFDLETTEEASMLVEADTMVKTGRLKFECQPLWLAKGTTLR